jgi:prevent-host-death family protein
MPQVNMHEAKTNFSKLVEMALRGEEVIIARHGKPLVRLTPVDAPVGLRPIGLHRLEHVSDTFFEESMKPLDKKELSHWYDSPWPAPLHTDDTESEKKG